jgi:hypothetical protein
MNTTGTEETKEWTEKRDIPHGKYKQNPENIPYYDWEKIYPLINRNQHKQQFDEDGEVILSRNDDFQQPLDGDAQGNVLTQEERALITMNDYNRIPNKEASHKINNPPLAWTEPKNTLETRKQNWKNKETIRNLHQKHTKTTPITGRKTRNGNRSNETSLHGHTKYFNNKDTRSKEANGKISQITSSDNTTKSTHPPSRQDSTYK